MKSAGIAAVLSVIFSGLGQIYNGQIFKGLVILLVQAANVFVVTEFFIASIILIPLAFISIPFAVVLWVWAIYDAYRGAEKINRRRAGRELW